MGVRQAVQGSSCPRVRLLGSGRRVQQECAVGSNSRSPPGSSVQSFSIKNTGVGCHFLIQGIFPTQESNPSFLHCRQILYRLCHQGRPLCHIISLNIGCRSLTHSCLTLCNSMDCSTPGLPVHHQLPEFAQTHVRRVSDASQPSHPLLSPLLHSIFLIIRVFFNESAPCFRWLKYWSFSISPSNAY